MNMSEKYQATGTIIRLHDTKQITDKFCKREFVLEIPDGKYPQPVLFQVTGDRCNELDEFRLGDELEVQFNLRGRIWEGNGNGERCFVSLDVWRMKRVSEGVASSAGAAQGTEPEQEQDIPF